jgi:hypothetical protein
VQALILLFHRQLQLPAATKNCCYVLGNGPSLNADTEGKIDFLKQQDLFVVNHIAKTELFRTLQPRFYVFADPAFWLYDKSDFIEQKEKVLETFAAMKAADWRYTVFVPYKTKKYFLRNFPDSPNISFVEYGATVIDRLDKWLKYAVYRKNLAMPMPMNVTNAAVFIAVNIGYKEVNLLGADHDWVKNISVDEHGNLLQYDTHFNDLSPRAEVLPYTMPFILDCCSTALKSHHQINEYALSKGVEIKNLTSKTMVDAYKRGKFTI